MNVLYISHCDVTGHSANHVFQVAIALRNRGVDPAVAIPRDPHSTEGRGNSDLHVLYHDDVAREGLAFADGRGPDLIHAWTPREHVRKLTQLLVARYECRYVVHLEDNEDAIAADELQPFPFAEFSQLPTKLLDQIVPWNRQHPRRARSFLEGASGVTTLIDRLLEFKPDGIPGAVFWPGFDGAFLSSTPSATSAVTGEPVIVYTGNIHSSNEEEVASLILAVGIVNRRGRKVKLIKTGSNLAAKDIVKAAEEAGFLIDLGTVPRAELPALLHQAAVLVQPGQPGPFNDYRFPSKLPEFLATGRPVILPATNIGLVLKDGVECIRLTTGKAPEIAEKIEELLLNPAKAKAIGEAGKAFALANLNWSSNAEPILNLYKSLADRRPPTDPPAEPELIRLMVDREPLADSPNYLELAMTSFNVSPRVKFQPGGLYSKWLAATVERTMSLRTIRKPVIYLQGCPGGKDPEWLESTIQGLSQGIANYLRNQGLPVLNSQVERYVFSSPPEAFLEEQH